MLARLLYRDARGLRQATDFLPKRPAFLGRAAGSLVPTHDPSVADHHCQISYSEPGWFLEALDSTSGTLVNGELVSRCVLRHHDTIRCGDLIVQFAEDPPPIAKIIPTATTKSDEDPEEYLARLSRNREAAELARNRLEQDVERSDLARVAAEEECRRLRDRLEQSGRDLVNQAYQIEQREQALREQGQVETRLRAMLKEQARKLEEAVEAAQQFSNKREAALKDRQLAANVAGQLREEMATLSWKLHEKETIIDELRRSHDLLLRQNDELRQVLHAAQQEIKSP